MGPGWLDITNYSTFSALGTNAISAPVTAQRTYCDYEFTVDMERMKNIAYNTTEQRLPPLAKMVALNVVTSLNGTEKEICMVSALYNPKCALTNPSTERKHLQRFCGELLCTFPSKICFSTNKDSLRFTAIQPGKPVQKPRTSGSRRS